MKLAIVQIAAAPESPEAALGMLERALDQAPDADLLLLPELALCGYDDAARIQRLAEPQDGPTLRAAARLAAERNQALAFGYAEREGEHLFNAMQVIGRDGVQLANYRKTHLWGGHERELFQPGNQLVSFQLDQIRCGLLICYDLDFPEATRQLAVNGVDLLLCISATTADYAVVPMAVVPARAYENGCFVAFANRGDVAGEFPCVGLSRIAGPSGAVMGALSGNGAGVVSAQVERQTLIDWRQNHPSLVDRRQGLTLAELRART